MTTRKRGSVSTIQDRLLRHGRVLEINLSSEGALLGESDRVGAGEKGLPRPCGRKLDPSAVTALRNIRQTCLAEELVSGPVTNDPASHAHWLLASVAAGDATTADGCATL